MLKSRIGKAKNDRNNNKVITRKHFENKECNKTSKKSAGSYEARKKDLKNELLNYRKKGSRLNTNLAECQREEMIKYDEWQSNRMECER